MNRHAYGVTLGLLLVLSVLISACATPQAVGTRNKYVEAKPWSSFGTAPDPYWWSDRIEMGKLHKNAKKFGNGRTVAILDSGFAPNQPDVMPPTRIHSAKVETCSPTSNKNVDDINGHGTAMAVIALGDEKPDTAKGQATGGIAAKAMLLPIKVVCGVSTADSVTRGLDAAVAVNPPVDVILLALGGWPSDRTTDGKNETVDAHLSDILKKHRDILFVVASIWDGTSYMFPTWTSEENVIVVAAMTQKPTTIIGPPTEEYYSDKRGDIWAPGRDVQTAFIDSQDLKISGKYGDYLMQGSSAAAAIVAGCAAAVKLPSDTIAKTLRDRLVNTAQTTNALPGGEPRLNCLAAVGP